MTPQTTHTTARGAAPAYLPHGLRLLTLAVLLLATIYYVTLSWHWRIMVDSAVMHYVVFLMRHGLRPYVEISDNNMPGAYLTEAVGMSLFGLSDVGWRLYEFAVLCVLTAGLTLIARRWDALAGIFAGGMFLVVHSAEGPQYAAERELTLTTLLVLAYVLLFAAVNRRRTYLLFLFGVASGVAASIKPTFLPLPLALLGLAVYVLRQRRQPVVVPVLFALGGLGCVCALDFGFLLYFHALHDFLFILRAVLPTYVHLGTPMPYGRLLAYSLPRVLYPLLLVYPVLAFMNRRQGSAWSWERWALLLGAGFGLLSFVIQRKGYLHHRYTFLVLLLLLVGTEIFLALRSNGATPYVAACALLFCLAVAVPRTLRATHAVVGHSDLELSLESDLNLLGGTNMLQDKVQCFDLVYGCLDALYHLRSVENSGFTGDLLFFPLRNNIATDYYRERFWRGVRTDPPQVIVLTNQNLQGFNSFDKVQRWPAFDAWLSNNYTPVVERFFRFEHFGGRFPSGVPQQEQDGYRLYLRDNSPFLDRVPALQATKASGQF